MEQVLLNNGVKMPVEGFGVFQISDEAQCWQCVLDALETGYRLFDTAAAYHNEQAVGRAVRDPGSREMKYLSLRSSGCRMRDMTRLWPRLNDSGKIWDWII